MLKPFLLITAVVLLAGSPALAPALSPQDAAQAPSAKGAAKAASESHSRAKKVYDIDCAICHGATGDGKTDLAKDMQLNLLDWSDTKSLANMTDQQLFDVIRKGKGKMPAEDTGRAKNEEVKALVDYIRSMAGKEQPAAAPAPAPAEQPAPATAPASSPAPGK
jgi:cytochrome c5